MCGHQILKRQWYCKRLRGTLAYLVNIPLLVDYFKQLKRNLVSVQDNMYVIFASYALALTYL